MVKLQKAIRQEQRKSLSAKPKVAKLTPAEIRSLNHGVGLSKAGSVRSIDNHSIRRLASTTPPLTPDHHHSLPRSQSQRRSSADLPTPPLSPDRERRGSASSTRQIYAPRPISHAQTVHLANAAGISRPSSQSSYRGVATYRGNEITRNNSLTMLQYPSQQIVSNPLSQFSRPRQSTMTSSTSPSKPGSEHQPNENVTNLLNIRDRAQSLPATDHAVTRDHSPIRPSDSPVSMEHGEAPRKTNQTQHDPRQEIPVVQLTPRMDDTARQDDRNEPSVKQKLSWRRTLTGSSEPDPDVARLRKEFKRRTLLSPKNGYCLHAIHYDDTKAGSPPQLRDSLRDQLPSAHTSVFKEDEAKQADQDTEYGQHPAVRPLGHHIQRSTPNDSDSSLPSSNKKGKEKEIDTADSDTSSLASSVPSYSRCSCCGRVQKPGGFESELSPVMENENLRANFSMEVERMSTNHRRRSSSLNADGQRRYIPIIPMEVGNEMKQARIEPARESQTQRPMAHPASTQPALLGVAVNKPGDIIGPGSTPLAIMPRRKVDPRIVRFASLHRTKEDKLEEEAQQKLEDPVQNLAPPQPIQRFGSLYGTRNESQQPQIQQQQIQPQQQSNVPSAYQSQQARQQQRTNGSHPLRESYTAHQEVTLPQQEQAKPHDHESTESNHSIEKPLGDSPSAQRSEAPASPLSNFSDDYDAAMVDLSSFDGSFVHSSLSRSATTVLHKASPPTTSSGMFPSRTQESFQNGENKDQAHPSEHTIAAQNTSSVPNKIDTTADNFENRSTQSTSSTTSDQTPYYSASQLQSRPETPKLETEFPNSSVHKPAPMPTTATTTIVRILPSTPVPSSSSNSPITGKGPLRLGDWVLPESPTTSALGSRRGSLQSEQLRGVAAA